MEANDCSVFGMMKDLFNKKMTGILVIIYAYSIIFVAGCVLSGIKFFDAAETRDQIMYAVIFMSCIQFICLLKIFAWQMIHRNGIRRRLNEIEAKIKG